MSLRVGDRAPAFSRTAHDGKTIELGGELPQVLVLYFYPADETTGCTMEACRFRDDYEAFTDAGAVVVGVSPDGLDSHRRFAEHHRLPFSLLSDGDGELRRKYDVGRTLGLIPGRVTYVIDRKGVIQHVFDSQLRARKHVDEALEVVRRLRG
ncbi:peroxiredoxin [Paraliomyxa miuraensis]|uniref:peroxiredoxin n=1 Tax=Paraliomyxa miuraensis TaxID=376150 RepID=UPI00224E9319|nr:peroxiredoxin [Paraliomyxa miuraensis]MCX4243812.1 peroxiredoxin [Paraliomyxa miuraensis]